MNILDTIYPFTLIHQSLTTDRIHFMLRKLYSILLLKLTCTCKPMTHTLFSFKHTGYTNNYHPLYTLNSLLCSLTEMSNTYFMTMSFEFHFLKQLWKNWYTSLSCQPANRTLIKPLCVSCIDLSHLCFTLTRKSIVWPLNCTLGNNFGWMQCWYQTCTIQASHTIIYIVVTLYVFYPILSQLIRNTNTLLK